MSWESGTSLWTDQGGVNANVVAVLISARPLVRSAGLVLLGFCLSSLVASAAKVTRSIRDEQSTDRDGCAMLALLFPIDRPTFHIGALARSAPGICCLPPVLWRGRFAPGREIPFSGGGISNRCATGWRGSGGRRYDGDQETAKQDREAPNQETQQLFNGAEKKTPIPGIPMVRISRRVQADSGIALAAHVGAFRLVSIPRLRNWAVQGGDPHRLAGAHHDT